MSAQQRRRWQVGEAVATGVRRPDGRWQLGLPAERPEAWPALLDQAEDGWDLVTQVSGDLSPGQRQALTDARFTAGRTETLWLLPISGLPRRSLAGPHELVPVDQLEPAAVAGLDNEIRRDIPGAERWAGTAADLLESLSDDEFDPALYLVARHRELGSLDGLIRVWNRTPYPRLGCLGVRREWRRTSLAATLLVAVAEVLAGRGVEAVITETDEQNWDSCAMARRVGGEVTGTTQEWIRPASRG